MPRPVVAAGEQFGSPRGHPGSGVQQRHERFAPVEGGVERGEVADLQGHRAQTEEGGEVAVNPCPGAHVAAPGNPACTATDPACSNGAGQPGVTHERPQQQREADLEGRQPRDDLQDELDRSLGGQNPIARLRRSRSGRR